MEYKKEIENIVMTLRNKYNPKKIILFGSCVSGKINDNSDIDMLIIKGACHSSRLFLRRQN